MRSAFRKIFSVAYVILFVCVSSLGLFLPIQPVSAVTTLRADAVTHAHWIRTADSSTSYDNDPGFATPLANIRARSTFDQGLVAFAELYFASRNSSDDAIEIGSVYGSTGSYFPGFSLTGGKFEVPYGLQRTYRSDHAQVQSNPLIGNPLVDPTDHQVGLLLRVPRFFGELSASLTNGSGNDNFNQNRGFGSSLRLKTHPVPGTTFAVSGYRSYHSDTTASVTTDSVTTDNLFGPETDTDNDPIDSLENLQSGRSEPYSNVDPGLGGRPDVLTIGRDLTAWQVDLVLSPGIMDYLRGATGRLKDNLSNLDGPFSSGASTVEWRYYTAETRMQITDKLYLAGRWNKVRAVQLEDVPELGDDVRNGTMERFQLGMGYRLSNNLVVKSEYVSSTEDITTDQIKYDGLTVEVSITGYPRLDPVNLSSSNGNH